MTGSDLRRGEKDSRDREEVIKADIMAIVKRCFLNRRDEALNFVKVVPVPGSATGCSHYVTLTHAHHLRDLIRKLGGGREREGEWVGG